MKQSTKYFYLVIGLLTFFVTTVVSGNDTGGTLKIDWKQYSLSDSVWWGLTWSPDSKYVASVDRYVKQISIINVEMGIVERHLTLPDNLDYVLQLDWSPNGSYLAFTANKKDQMWQYALGYIVD